MLCRCGNCGADGHVRTSSVCPLYHSKPEIEWRKNKALKQFGPSLTYSSVRRAPRRSAEERRVANAQCAQQCRKRKAEKLERLEEDLERTKRQLTGVPHLFHSLY